MQKMKIVGAAWLMCLVPLADAAPENHGKSQPPAVAQAQPAPGQQATVPGTQASTPQPQPTPAQPPKAAKVKKSKLYGTIQTVDQAAGKVSIKTTRGEVKEIVLSDTTKLTKGGNHKVIALADLKEKNRVVVTLEGDAVVSLHVNVASR